MSGLMIRILEFRLKVRVGAERAQLLSRRRLALAFVVMVGRLVARAVGRSVGWSMGAKLL